ncbi:MAG: SAM-dependent DNA methyltransferase [Selenomonadaceae bacterium]|nr:SAM-dependent DNA methyltransferase [Selenomonadaceae bacterium]MBR1645244.1 SAM-dependent DNA methyltransferase [Selenomonadaceae bacterium]MBR1806229.1 SAM-dependent DNA methyltransferase [Selenomonadaceae bacterium]
MMPVTDKLSTERVKKFAEVFTPPGVVFSMILQDGIRSCVADVDKTILDPAVGHGQYPCGELVWKMFFGLDRLNEEFVLRAIKSLHAIDIQPASVEIAKQHMIKTACDAYKFFTGKEFTRTDDARKILDENFICGDSLKIMRDWAAPQQKLF